MLTERRVRDARAGSISTILWDSKVLGLGCKVFPTGRKSYVLSYRAGGRKRLATLARCSEISLQEARERAGRDLAAIRDGEAGPLERRRKAREAPTVEEGVQRFFDEYMPRRMADGRMAERTRYDYEKQAARTILPALGSKRITDVTRADIERTIAPRAPVQRNRTLSLLRRLFNLFEEWEWREQNTNPAHRIEKAHEEPRDRVLAPSEIQALGEALKEIDAPYPVAAIRFLLMTGWRTGEALALKWEHINFEVGEITLPSTKTGRQTRTVAALALQVIDHLPQINGNPYVFAGARSAAIAYKTLRACFVRACDRAGIEDCRLHDIRRSVATSAAGSGLSVLLLRDLLNHKTVAMANRYARRAGTALQVAQDASAERMAGMMEGRGGEVVPTRISQVTALPDA